MRIVHIGPSALPIGHTFGGAVERRMVELAGAQASRGHEVVIVSVAPEDSAGAVFAVPGVRVHDVVCRTKRPWRDLELVTRARAQLRDVAPDVVHVHNNAPAAVLLADIPAPKVLSFDYFRYRGTSRRATKAVYRRALTAFDLLLPVSDFCAAAAASWWSLPPSYFRVLPNGVNVVQFSPDARRRTEARLRYQLNDAVVIGAVGRVCEQKGSDTLVAAFRMVKGACPTAALLVAGPADRFGHPGSTPLTDDIGAVGGRWIGPVREDDLADVFRSFDVCAVPTREDEMFGMVAAEALASGTPVVCSDLGGLPAVVPPTAGVLVPAADPAALAAGLLKLCADPARRAALSAAAPGVARKFSWLTIAEQAERIYDEVRRR